MKANHSAINQAEKAAPLCPDPVFPRSFQRRILLPDRTEKTSLICPLRRPWAALTAIFLSRPCAKHSRFKRRLSCAALSAVLFLGGCSGQAPEAQTEAQETASRLQIGLSFDSFVIERWLRDRDMFVSTAQSLGADVNVQVAGGDEEEQIAQIEYFIQKEMDVIVIIPKDGSALKDVVNKALDAGIQVICYDRLIPDVETQLYISYDNEQVGALMAEALKEACPGGGNIFAIYGSPTDLNVADTVRGFTEGLKGSGLEIVYSGYCDNWLSELAFDHVTEGLSQTTDLVGIMCGNDDLAGQAIKALSEHRLSGKVAVVAQDAELGACQRIVEGTQTMTVYKDVEAEAETAAKLAVALGRGEDITSEDCEIPVTDVIRTGDYEIPCYLLTPVAVTAENLDEVILEGNFHSAEDVYLNVADGSKEPETNS